MAGFVWKVAVKGYDWRDYYWARAPEDIDGSFCWDGQVLVPMQWRFRTYAPLKAHTALFHEFAFTEVTQEGIRRFANKFGHLGDGHEDYWTPPSTFDADPDLDAAPERGTAWPTILQKFDAWKRAILDMRSAVDLWDYVRKGAADRRSVQRLKGLINGRLKRVGVTTNFEMASAVPYQPNLNIVPTNLHGAMWLQLAQAIEANKKYRNCRTCSKWFELSPDTGARISRFYCSNACRSRAYRRRQDRARRLETDGMSLREIAKELRSDVPTVKKWLTK